MSDRNGVFWFAIALGFILILGLTSPTLEPDNTDLATNAVNIEVDESTSLAYIPHDPIYIDDASDFSGWPYEDGRYIIENLFIDANGTDTPCIYIEDSISMPQLPAFVIRNCYLNGSSLPSGAGVSLNGVWYGGRGEISNNTCTGNNYGIYLYNSAYLNITNNICNSNGNGIYLQENSWHNTLINNTCNSNTQGIYLQDHCRFNTIIDSTCNGNSENGIHFSASDDNDVANSTCNNNQYGISLLDSWGNNYTNNTCTGNNVVGIKVSSSYVGSFTNNVCNNNYIGIYVVDGSSHTTLTNNTCSSNTMSGIVTQSSDYANLISNNCSSNGDYGVDLNGAQYYIVINNTFNDNFSGNRFLATGFSTIANNNCSYNGDHGMFFAGGADNTIANNTCNYNSGSGMAYCVHFHNIVVNNTCNNNEWHGIHLGGLQGGYTMRNTQNFTLTHNTCSNNNYRAASRGILIDSISIDHTIIWNTFVNNSVDGEDQQNPAYNDNVYDYNFWSDYAGVDANQDGIGDTPHAISGTAGHSDPHPLMFSPTPPKWNETPTDQTITDLDVLYYDLNITSHAPVNWSVSDEVHFTIDENGTLESLGTLTIGDYVLLVNVTNIYNVSIWVEFTVSVLPWDTTAPTWDLTPEDQAVEYGLSFRYDVNATDPTGISHWWLNSTDFTIDVDGVIENTTVLSVDVYWLEIYVNDTYGNMQSEVISITVDDTTSPSWVTTPENQMIEYGEIFSYDLDASDLAGISHWWLNSTDFTIDADGVITNATILSVTVYGLEIYVNDTHGNVQNAIITVTVEGPTTTTTPTTPTSTTDTTAPTSPTTPTGTTPSGLDPLVIIALGAGGAIAVLIIIIVFIKKKS